MFLLRCETAHDLFFFPKARRLLRQVDSNKPSETLKIKKKHFAVPIAGRSVYPDKSVATLAVLQVGPNNLLGRVTAPASPVRHRRGLYTIAQ